MSANHADVEARALAGVELRADVLPEGVAWMIVAPRQYGDTLEDWARRCVVARKATDA